MSLKLDEVREWVEQIRVNASDDEYAHQEEDRLRLAVLTAIAQGTQDAQALAQAAIETDNFDFARWCA